MCLHWLESIRTRLTSQSTSLHFLGPVFSFLRLWSPRLSNSSFPFMETPVLLTSLRYCLTTRAELFLLSVLFWRILWCSLAKDAMLFANGAVRSSLRCYFASDAIGALFSGRRCCPTIDAAFFCYQWCRNTNAVLFDDRGYRCRWFAIVAWPLGPSMLLG